MAQQIINIGAVANDHTGDQLRTAFNKINANFTELYAATVVSIDRTYYVRTDGSDSNSGTADTAGGAWLTIQHALDWVASYLSIDAGTTVTIQLGDGTYTGNIVVPVWRGAGTLLINGNSGTPGNVIVTSSSGTTLLISGTTINVSNFELRSTSADCVFCYGRGQITMVDGMRFGSSSRFLRALNGSSIFVGGTVTITSGAQFAILVENSSSILASGAVFTLVGTPAWSTTFIRLAGCSGAIFPGSSNSFSGASTGKRYEGIGLAYINTSGAGANYFPGNSAGSVSNGALYV